MKLALALIAMISAGCGIDTAAPARGGIGGSAGGGGGGGGGRGSGSDPGGGGDPGTTNDGDPGDGTGPVTSVSGHIAANAKWVDVIHVVGDVTIDTGATLQVGAGTTVDLASGTSITVLEIARAASLAVPEPVTRNARPASRPVSAAAPTAPSLETCRCGRVLRGTREP